MFNKNQLIIKQYVGFHYIWVQDYFFIFFEWKFLNNLVSKLNFLFLLFCNLRFLFNMKFTFGWKFLKNLHTNVMNISEYICLLFFFCCTANSLINLNAAYRIYKMWRWSNKLAYEWHTFRVLKIFCKYEKLRIYIEQ